MAERSPRLAARMAEIEPFHVMDLLARARALEARGRSIVHMEIGEPDFPTPEPIVRAGIEALRRGQTHYTSALGLPALREAIAGHYRTRFGAVVDPAQVVVTPGSSIALHLVLATLIGPGDGVLLADPGYPCNRHFVRLCEGLPQPVAVGPESRYQLTAEAVRSHAGDHTRAVLVATPANPTGTSLPHAGLAALADAAHTRGLALIVDEIYQGLSYGTEPCTAVGLPGEVFIVNSFSKFFGMTGWRLGWLVAPPAYVPALDRLAQNLYLAAPTPAQHAALAAFDLQTLGELEARRLEFRRRRDFLLPALRGLGLGIPVEPDGAFYLYADAGGFTDDSFALAERLLVDHGVAVTPGRDFGFNRPERHLRFAYTRPIDELERGVERLRQGISR